MSPLTLHPLFRDDPERRLVGIERDEAVITKLRSQYTQARAAGQRLAQIFYERLFRQYPEVRPMFRDDPATQHAKLMDSLDAIFSFLDQPEQHIPLLRELGQLHAAYGAAPVHYRIVSELLADAVAEVLPRPIDTGTRQDWLDAFQLISDHMLAGAAELKD
ncbi:MAG: globin domain-containing protein [Phycisphaerales bacterium]